MSWRGKTSLILCRVQQINVRSCAHCRAHSNIGVAGRGARPWLSENLAIPGFHRLVTPADQYIYPTCHAVSGLNGKTGARFSHHMQRTQVAVNHRVAVIIFMKNVHQNVSTYMWPPTIKLTFR